MFSCLQSLLEQQLVGCSGDPPSTVKSFNLAATQQLRRFFNHSFTHSHVLTNYVLFHSEVSSFLDGRMSRRQICHSMREISHRREESLNCTLFLVRFVTKKKNFSWLRKTTALRPYFCALLESLLRMKNILCIFWREMAAAVLFMTIAGPVQGTSQGTPLFFISWTTRGPFVPWGTKRKLWIQRRVWRLPLLQCSFSRACRLPLPRVDTLDARSVGLFSFL